MRSNTSLLACASGAIAEWFYKGEQETVRNPCSLPSRFMGARGFAWRTIENARDPNDSQGFCSRIRWRPKSAISFPHRLLCPESLSSHGFSKLSGKPSGSLFLASALCAKGLFYRGFGTFCGGTFFGKLMGRSAKSHANLHLWEIK